MEPAAAASWHRTGFAAADALRVNEPSFGAASDERPLGTAIAQLHGLFVLAQNRAGLVLVDMHAAHERVLYESFKAQHAAGGTPAAQRLLEPLAVAAAEHEIDTLLAAGDDFARLGFELERLAPGQLAVRSVPAMLATADLPALLREPCSTICPAIRARITSTAPRIACSERSPAAAPSMLIGALAWRKWTRCCDKWRLPSDPHNAITGDRRGRRCRSRNSIACSCEADESAVRAGAHRTDRQRQERLGRATGAAPAD